MWQHQETCLCFQWHLPNTTRHKDTIRGSYVCLFRSETAEVRTFPTVHFPALQLLKREEVECGKVEGVRMIAAAHATGLAHNRRTYLEAPFDLLYGFRPGDHNVQLLSPFEMLMHWQMVEVCHWCECSTCVN